MVVVYDVRSVTARAGVVVLAYYGTLAHPRLLSKAETLLYRERKLNCPTIGRATYSERGLVATVAVAVST